jgi:hypothetical protein
VGCKFADLKPIIEEKVEGGGVVVSPFLRCAGYDTLNLTLVEPEGVDATLDVEFSFDGKEVHGVVPDVIGADNFGKVEVRAGYFRLKATNTSENEQVFSAFVYMVGN